MEASQLHTYSPRIDPGTDWLSLWLKNIQGVFGKRDAATLQEDNSRFVSRMIVKCYCRHAVANLQEDNSRFVSRIIIRCHAVANYAEVGRLNGHLAAKLDEKNSTQNLVMPHPAKTAASEYAIRSHYPLPSGFMIHHPVGHWPGWHAYLLLLHKYAATSSIHSS